jgi:hypothetical protein
MSVGLNSGKSEAVGKLNLFLNCPSKYGTEDVACAETLEQLVSRGSTCVSEEAETKIAETAGSVKPPKV